MRYAINTALKLKDGTRLAQGDVHDGELPDWLIRQGHATPLDKPTKKPTARKAPR